jgi:hypothetical protein
MAVTWVMVRSQDPRQQRVDARSQRNPTSGTGGIAAINSDA